MNAFRDNAPRQRYELEAPEGASFADYRDAAGARLITHVETPAAAQGKGYASKLMHAIVEDARARGLKLAASCSFAQAYFARNANSKDVQA